MRGLEDGDVAADVGARSHAQAAHQTGAQVGNNVAVQVGQHHHVEVGGVLHQTHARCINDLVVELDVRVTLGHLAGDAQVHAVSRFHDVGLVHGGHLAATAATGVLKRVLDNALRTGDGDRLERKSGIGVKRLAARPLHDARDLRNAGIPLVKLDARVQVFGVFTDDDKVDVLVARAVARLRKAGSDARIQVEVLAQCHVDAAKARSNRRGDGALDRHLRVLDRIEHVLGQRGAILLDYAGAGIHRVPFDLDSRGVDNATHRRRDLRANAIAGYKCDLVCHVALLLVLVIRFRCCTRALLGLFKLKTLKKGSVDLGRPRLKVGALTVFGIEANAAGELGCHLGIDIAAGELVQAAQHIAILKIAVIALDGLVDYGPHLGGACGRYGAPSRHKAECGQAQRCGKLIEQGVLGTVVGSVKADIAGGGHQQGKRIENLPARLGLGPVQRVDQLLGKGNQLGRIALREQLDHARRRLALATTMARKVLDHRGKRVAALFDQCKLLHLLGRELMLQRVCHKTTSNPSYRPQPK